MLDKWLAMPGARMVQNCAGSEGAIVIRIEFPEPEARDRATLSASTSGSATQWPPAMSGRLARMGDKSRHASVAAASEGKPLGAPAKGELFRCIACDQGDGDWEMSEDGQ